MKVIVGCVFFLIVVSINAWQPKTNEELVQYRDECFKSENISQENQAKILKHIYPDDPSVHCFVKCTSEKTGTWNENGPDIERTWKQIHSTGNTMTQEDVDKCKPPKEEDACLWAYKGLMCILGNAGVKKPLIE